MDLINFETLPLEVIVTIAESDAKIFTTMQLLRKDFYEFVKGRNNYYKMFFSKRVDTTTVYDQGYKAGDYLKETHYTLPNGEKYGEFSEKFLKNGTLESYKYDGKIINFKNGKMISSSFSDGNGSFISFHENGNIEMIIEQQESASKGLNIEYYPNGALKSSHSYLNDITWDGFYQTFYENGQLNREGIFEGNLIICENFVGEHKKYREDGTLEYVHIYDKNKNLRYVENYDREGFVKNINFEELKNLRYNFDF